MEKILWVTLFLVFVIAIVAVFAVCFWENSPPVGSEKTTFSVGEKVRLFDHPEIVGTVEVISNFDSWGLFYKVRVISPYSGEPNRYWYTESELRPYHESIHRENPENE